MAQGDAGEAAQDYRAGLSEADVRVSVVWKLEKEQIHALHIHFSLPEEDFLPCRAEDLTGTAADEYHGSADRKEAAYYKKLSERDLMTGLYNRGSFEKYVKLQLNEVGGGTFYMIDLDDFKAVNDTYGHVAGDRVIAGMAGILREVFGESAVIGRLGGDEFAVFENGSSSRKESEEKARRVMQAYRLMSEKYGNEILLSCSIGLYREKGKETFENLYSCADEALYFSKNSYKGTFHWYYRQCRT